MTLANLRHNGVRSMWVVCVVCHHGTVLNVDTYADEVTVPSFGSRMVCTCCGIIGADVRPNWSERPQSGSLTARQWR
jgi:hypothetical protein